MLNEEDRNLEETGRACDRGSDDPFRRAGGVCRRADGLRWLGRSGDIAEMERCGGQP